MVVGELGGFLQAVGGACREGGGVNFHTVSVIYACICIFFYFCFIVFLIV